MTPTLSLTYNPNLNCSPNLNPTLAPTPNPNSNPDSKPRPSSNPMTNCFGGIGGQGRGSPAIRPRVTRQPVPPRCLVKRSHHEANDESLGRSCPVLFPVLSLSWSIFSYPNLIFHILSYRSLSYLILSYLSLHCLFPFYVILSYSS